MKHIRIISFVLMAFCYASASWRASRAQEEAKEARAAEREVVREWSVCLERREESRLLVQRANDGWHQCLDMLEKR